MKKTILALAGTLLIALVLVKCTKQQSSPVNDILPPAERSSAAANPDAPAPCVPFYYDLAIDPGTGFSYVYKISGTPSCGPVAVSLVGQVVCSGNPVKFMTGLSYDPVSGVFYGTTGPGSNPVNSIVKFTAPGIGAASCAPLNNPCGLVLNVSDIERNQVTGVYYAINRGNTAFNQRVVTIDLSTLNVNCLPCTVSLNFNPRGLTFDCSGTMWLMAMVGQNGRLLKTDPNGCVGTICSYPGVITPPTALTAPEMGLHYDCCCNRFVTGNYDPVGPAPLLTDGVSPCFGAASYAALAGVIKPTVDFARP